MSVGGSEWGTELKSFLTPSVCGNLVLKVLKHYKNVTV